MSRHFFILDCFVDEPACFGVPPFVSPYPRYVYGALIDAGVSPDDITYTTIEELRRKDLELEAAEMVFLIGGAAVPGKYLGHRIGTVPEITGVLEKNRHLTFCTGGTIGHLIDPSRHRNLLPLTGDIEKFAYGHAKGNADDDRRTYDELARWAPPGAAVCGLHPSFPNIICEIETFRGCPRLQHCSFCSEGLRDTLEFRRPEDIIGEIDALIGRGVTRFRLGRQADILQYGTRFDEFRNGFPAPRPEAVRGLFSALRTRRDSGRITTLNVDNANPGTLCNFPDESMHILEIIAESITPGDTLALGVESLDPAVIQKNGLKIGPEGLMGAVSLVNEAGGRRVNGIPLLLPGINLIHGLAGETADTFKMNYEGLAAIRDRGLLLKRINIRKLVPFPGTPMYRLYREPAGRVRKRYEFYRDKIREEIDHWMLQRIYPAGTLLGEVLVENRRFDHSLGKQISSYSITARVPMALPVGRLVDVVVVGHRERSVIALPLPLDLNTLPLKALEMIPGIGKKKASAIVLQRPFASREEASPYLGDVPSSLLQMLEERF